MARLPEPQVLGTGLHTESRPHSLTIGFVGSGRAASTLAHSLGRAGHRLLLAHRDPAADELAAELGASTSGAAEVLARAAVTFLAVPDGAVAKVAAQLAEDTPDGRGRLVAHLSGSQGRDVLEPLAARGYATAAIHPLQVLSGWRLAPGTAFAVEAEGPPAMSPPAWSTTCAASRSPSRPVAAPPTTRPR